VDPRAAKPQEFDADLLRSAQRRSARLLGVADPFIAAAHAKYGDRPHLMALLDADARVLRIAADPNAEQQGRSINAFEGASWAERDFGCNGGGTALAAGKPVVLIGPEHLIDTHRAWTCIGVPLRNPDGSLAGSLDWSVPNESVELWAWGWILGISRVVEEHLASGTVCTPEHARRSIEGLQNPFNVVRGMFELLGTQLGGMLPTHRKLLEEAAATVEVAETALQESLRASAEMQQELAAANQRLLSATLAAKQRAKDAEEANARAERMAARLREADQRKDEFLAMLSHELRNPLAPITTSVYVVENAEPGSEQAARARAVIKRQSEHLTRLVDDLLDVTRIARGKIELRRTVLDVREVLARAGDDFRLLFDAQGVAFRTAFGDTALWSLVDAARLTQIVGNLLANARKFTRAGDCVTLSAGRSEGAVEIRVKDTGAGIDSALVSHVFDPFVQGSRTLARADGGLGLGLALVKGIAELHGGAVAVESAGQGKGAEFIVRLPSVATPSTEVPVSSAVRPAGVRRVLVVDDNRDAADSLADVVKMLGHVAEVAYDASSAIEKARTSLPDVVLCDIGLPGMNGYDVARTLCARPASRSRMRLVALTGYTQPEDVKKAVDAGFQHHLSKPCGLEALARLLSEPFTAS
jgi:signal transduction histidine kinase/ActR/RegA family two-component response regulator